MQQNVRASLRGGGVIDGAAQEGAFLGKVDRRGPSSDRGDSPQRNVDLAKKSALRTICP